MKTGDIYDVAIAGGGPAGSSAAIHLAQQGLRVLLAEQKAFPREKLCGEFISPECIDQFQQLGVSEAIATAGGARLIETNFYSRRGNKVTVPSQWLGNRHAAIGLSRAEMDRLLFERAKQVGVKVLEATQVVEALFEKNHVRGMRVRVDGQVKDYRSQLTIDATGRTRALARRVTKATHDQKRARFVAFKTHVRQPRVASGACEIYFYPRGYGGLTSIENEFGNLCFIAAARDVRRSGSDPEQVLQSTVLLNDRARFTLGEAQFDQPWLSVALESFGRHDLVPARGLLLIGDAAAFIDPFTGSGMLMALESGALAARTIIEFRDRLPHESSFPDLANRYQANYKRTFNSRLRISGLLRRAAFIPRLAETAMICFGSSDWLRRKVAQATRPTPVVET